MNDVTQTNRTTFSKHTYVIISGLIDGNPVPSQGDGGPETS